MYRRIVVPVDGSELAERALPQAEALARLTGAPLHLVRVVDLTGLARYGSIGLHAEVTAFQQVLANEETLARDDLERTAGGLRERGLSVTTEQRRGDAATEIVGAIEPGDVIVMATHGRGGMKRWFLGSVAEEVVRHAPVPVLLVRALPVPAAVEAPKAATTAGAAG